MNRDIGRGEAGGVPRTPPSRILAPRCINRLSDLATCRNCIKLIPDYTTEETFTNYFEKRWACFEHLPVEIDEEIIYSYRGKSAYRSFGSGIS